MKIRASKNHISIEGKHRRNLFLQRGEITCFYVWSGREIREIMTEKNKLSTRESLMCGGVIIRKKESRLLCSFGKNKGVQ